MKVAELSGGLLDYWVARATGKGCWNWSDGGKVTYADWRKYHSLHTRFTNHSLDVFRPSTNWAQAGPIIDESAIGFHPISDAEWMAEEHITAYTGRGPTPLVAAMRAYVASKFGDEVADVEGAA